MTLIAAVIPAVTAAAASAAVTLIGAGSTLVAPIEAEWGTGWGSSTGSTVTAPTYSAVGSGTGLKDIGNGLVDFGASDAPISASTTQCLGCFQIPWALSATGVSFNVPGVHRLHLSGKVIAEIWLGQIKNWNDPRIKALNKHTSFPNLRITPLHRSDGSGDSYAFTDYLSSVNSTWAHQVGRGTKPSFPVGPGAIGNSGMVTEEEGTPGVIAYIAVSYLINRLPAAAIQNRAGKYEVPNLRNISNAASTVKSLPPTRELHIVNPPRQARIAYPISTFTYCVLKPTDPLGHGALLKSFVAYALGTGQTFGPSLDFVPLPARIKSADEAALSQIH